MENRLRELDEAKTVFFANSSHELRTPVTLITAPLDAIMAGRYGDDIPRNASILALVKRNADRLRRLADGLLELLAPRRGRGGSASRGLRPWRDRARVFR